MVYPREGIVVATGKCLCYDCATERCLLTEFATGGACVWRLCYVVGACKYHFAGGMDHQLLDQQPSRREAHKVSVELCGGL